MSKKNLSRRVFLKIATALGATGALAWIPDKLDAEADDVITDVIIDEEGVSDPPPFAPYYLEKPYPQYYENLMTLSYISGLGIGEISVKVNRHRWCCETILDYYQENGDFPDDF
jgi:hypothetical protein